MSSTLGGSSVRKARNLRAGGCVALGTHKLMITGWMVLAFAVLATNGL
jgi:hypothetical protein